MSTGMTAETVARVAALPAVAALEEALQARIDPDRMMRDIARIRHHCRNFHPV